jgi:hypothetical protein
MLADGVAKAHRLSDELLARQVVEIFVRGTSLLDQERWSN